jgi:hypothetical protein
MQKPLAHRGFLIGASVISLAQKGQKVVWNQRNKDSISTPSLNLSYRHFSTSFLYQVILYICLATHRRIETMAKGVDWKTVQAKALSAETQKLYADYVKKVSDASDLARKLKDAVKEEWDAKHPRGKDGQEAFFNAINGVLLFAYKAKDMAKAKAAKSLDLEAGENPF